MATPRQHLGTVTQAISIENTVVGEYLDGDEGAKFRKFPGDMTPPVFPTRQMIDDPMVGDGRGHKKKGKPYSFDPRNIPYNGALNTTMAARLVRMLLGGAITETVNAVPGTIDSLIEQKSLGDEPMCANILRNLGGEAFLHGDSFAQTWEASQQGKGEPRVTSQIQNSGHFAKIADTSIDVADIDPMDNYYRFHGGLTKLTFSDGVTSYDFANEGRLIDASVQLNQDVIVEGLPGDPFYDAANLCYGDYAENLYINQPSGMIRAKVYMGTDFTNFDAWLPNRSLTSVKLLFQACEIIGSTTHHPEIEIQFPVAQFNLEPDQNQNMSAFGMTIEAVDGDPVTGSLFKARVRQVGAFDETVA
jgi:hypothetical protein